MNLTHVLFLAGCGGDTRVTSDREDALPIDVTPIDRAFVAATESRTGFGWEFFLTVPDAFLEDHPDVYMEEGAFGMATVLLTADDLTCADLVDDAFLERSSGLILTFAWWVFGGTEATDPPWVGDYGLDDVFEDGETVRVGTVGAWTEAGATTWSGVAGGAEITSFAADDALGTLETNALDARFVAENCVGAAP